MRGRTILYMVAILVILVGVSLLVETSRQRATTASGKLLFPDLKTDLVDKIRIRAERKETVLEKKGDRWTVTTEGGFPAEPSYVKDILDRLPKFMADEVVSTNPSNQSVFQVDSTGTEVWVDQKGKEIGHFYVGKPGPDYMSTYVRSASSKSVVLVPDYLPSYFNRGDTWRERTLFTFKPEDVRGFEYASPTRGRFSVTKDEQGKWHQPAPDTTAVGTPGRIDAAVRSFSSLKAAGFADSISSAAAGLDADTTYVTATMADGSTQTLQVGLPAKKAGQSYARRKGADNIVIIARGALTPLMLPKEQMIMNQNPTPPPGRPFTPPPSPARRGKETN